MTTTSGDVTMQHWMRSCSYMAGPNWVLTIQTRSLTVAHLRHVREWMQRQWASEVRLTIAQDQRELISAELEGLTDRVSMAIEEKLTDEAIAFSGDRGNVIVAGRVIAEMQPALSIYAISHTQPGEEDEVYQALCSRHKLHRCSDAFLDEPSGEAERTMRQDVISASPDAPEQSVKSVKSVGKKRTKKATA